jgi:hypothetical protein
MSQSNYAPPSIQASSTTFAQLQTGGVAVLLNNLIAANPAIANPTTAPTVNVTGGGSTGGFLPAGTYFAKYTWTDGAGETPASSESTVFTVAAGNIPSVGVPAFPTGVAGWNLYLTPTNGASGTETLYSVGNFAGSFNASFAAGVDANATPPTVNTTGMNGVAPVIRKPFEIFQSRHFVDVSTTLSNFLSGYPVDFRAWYTQWAKYDYVNAAWKQMTKEIATLVAANPGSLHNVPTNVQNKVVRTFP